MKWAQKEMTIRTFWTVVGNVIQVPRKLKRWKYGYSEALKLRLSWLNNFNSRIRMWIHTARVWPLFSARGFVTSAWGGNGRSPDKGHFLAALHKDILPVTLPPFYSAKTQVSSCPAGSLSFWSIIGEEVKALASLPGSVASRRLHGCKAKGFKQGLSCTGNRSGGGLSQIFSKAIAEIPRLWDFTHKPKIKESFKWGIKKKIANLQSFP